MRRTTESLRKYGFLQTCRISGRWIVSQARWLSYESVCKLRPIHPSPTFDYGEERPRIVVQIHLFYPELLKEMIAYTNHIPYRFDCYISTDTEEKAERIRECFACDSHAEHTEVQVFANRGRDVAPLVLQLTPVIDHYDYLLHLHTKHSLHDDFGERWRIYLMNTLLASADYVAALLAKMEAPKKIGLVFQRTFRHVKPALGWKGNRRASKAFLARMQLERSMCREPRFPAGNMFWAKTAAVSPVFHCGLTTDDFPAESSQLDGTLAHCIERCWGCVAASQGYKILRVCPRKSRAR